VRPQVSHQGGLADSPLKKGKERSAMYDIKSTQNWALVQGSKIEHLREKEENPHSGESQVNGFKTKEGGLA